MRFESIFLVVAILAVPVFTQIETTASSWEEIVSDPTTFWGFLMGWGDDTTLEYEPSTEGTILATTESPQVFESSGNAVAEELPSETTEESVPTTLVTTSTATPFVNVDDLLVGSEEEAEGVQPPQQTTEIDLYEDDWDDVEEDMDLGETVYSWITILIPNLSHIVVSIFGTWIQMAASAVQMTIIHPVFTVLGKFFEIPMSGEVFNVPQILKDIASMIMYPLKEIGGFGLEGLSIGTEFMKPIIKCIGQSVTASQELLMMVFQIFPACATKLSTSSIQIIVDTMRVIENLTDVYIIVMETINSCVAHPVLCIFTSLAKAIWGITKATVEISQNSKILMDLIPPTTNAVKNCFVEESAQLVNRLPDISRLFFCQG